MRRIIKDPTYSIYSKGGMVVNKNKEIDKKQLADLEKLQFDLERDIIDTLQEDFRNQKKYDNFLDFLKSKDDDYFKRLSYAGGGKVIQFPLDLTKYKDIKPKEINLSGSFDKDRTIDSLSSDERALVNRLLRMSLGKGEK